jgi:hypothetical protein
MTSPQPPQPDPQAAQAGIADALTQALDLLWPLLALGALRRSLPSFKAAVTAIVRQHAVASAGIAARQYQAQRVAAGVGGRFTPIPAPPPPPQAVAEAVDWALAPLWSTAVPIAEFPNAPEETRRVASTAIADAKARLADASEKLVLDAGRDTVIGNVQRDAVAKGWARLTELDPCSFCAMLAARGAVYRSKQTAAFEAHDTCRCHVEPWFRGAYEPTAKARQWTKLYDDTARTIGYGTDGRVTAGDMRRAFRQAYEGRPVDIAASAPKPARGKTAATPRLGRTQDEIRSELAALETNFSRLGNDQQREWTSKRMETLRTQLGQ